MEANALKKVRFDYFDVFTKYASAPSPPPKSCGRRCDPSRTSALREDEADSRDENRADELSHRVSNSWRGLPLSTADIMALCNGDDGGRHRRHLEEHSVQHRKVSPERSVCEHLINAAPLSHRHRRVRDFKVKEAQGLHYRYAPSRPGTTSTSA